MSQLHQYDRPITSPPRTRSTPPASYHPADEDIKDIVKSAQDNLKKLQKLSLIPTDNHHYHQQQPKSPSKEIKKLSSKSFTPTSSTTRSNSVPKNKIHDNNSEIIRKVDFLFKKVKEIDQYVHGMKNDVNNIRNSTKETSNLSNHLSDLIKMDKHSIIEIKENITGIKQKLERLSQQDLLRGKYSVSTDPMTMTPDIGLLSEQIFHRVHKEFTKVVDEVVRTCVIEQIEFMKKWTTKSTNIEEDKEEEMMNDFRSQLLSFKRKQNQYDERLNELKDQSDQSSLAIQHVKDSLRTTSSDVHNLLDMMTKRVNESLSLSNLTLQNEIYLKIDSLSHQYTQEHTNQSNRIEILQKQLNEINSEQQSFKKEITHLSTNYHTLHHNYDNIQQHTQQIDQDLLQLHDVMNEMTQYLTENKKITQSLENSIQELNPQPIIDTLYNRIRENNEKIEQFDDILQGYNQEIQRLQELSWEISMKNSNQDQIPSPPSSSSTHPPSHHPHPYTNSSHRENEIDEILLKHEEKLQQILIILDEQHTDYQETISKLSNSNRKLKVKVKELVEKMGPLGDIKGSIDQILNDIIQGTRADKHVINSLKEENTQLITEILSLKILCENIEEKYEELRRKGIGNQQQQQQQQQQQIQHSSSAPPLPSVPTSTLLVPPTVEKYYDRVQYDNIAKIEEKVENLERTIQSISLNQEIKKFNQTLDQPMGISEIHDNQSSHRNTNQHQHHQNIERLDTSIVVAHPKGIIPVVHEDDAVSLISETWHGTIQTHESKPYLHTSTMDLQSNHELTGINGVTIKGSNTLPQSSLPNLRKNAYNTKRLKESSSSPVTHTARLPSDLIESHEFKKSSSSYEQKEINFYGKNEKITSPSRSNEMKSSSSSPASSPKPLGISVDKKELYLALHQKKLHHRQCFQAQMQISSNELIK